MNILITGTSGTGKSSLAKKLKSLGYKAFDIESYANLFTLINKTTNQPYESFNIDDLKMVKNSEWICNAEELRRLISQNQTNNNEPIFYLGTASNLSDILHLFDQVYLLVVPKNILRKRLSNRPKGHFARTKEVQDYLFSYLDQWQSWLIKNGAIVINANRPLDEIASEIVEKVNSH